MYFSFLIGIALINSVSNVLFVSKSITMITCKYIKDTCDISLLFLVSFQTWYFILIPATLYLIEVLWRAIRSRQPVDVISIRMHPCDVIELELLQDNFTAKPGQVGLVKHISY